MGLRRPAVAGTFYPGSSAELRSFIKDVLPSVPKERALAVVAPHAGYAYSGKVAGAVYGCVEIPRDVVILCFSHRGLGKDIAVWPEGAWRTPLGDAPVNADLARAIVEGCPGAEADETGHVGEHSGEVQVPFLQYVRPDVRIVPVALSAGFDALCAFGHALAGVPGDFLVVASTDLNHFEDQKTTLVKDAAVIAAMERLDERGLREDIRWRDISMCGVAPVTAAICYAKAKGARSARTVMHATSGDVSGDHDRVVGYVGMVMARQLYTCP